MRIDPNEPGGADTQQPATYFPTPKLSPAEWVIIMPLLPIVALYFAGALLFDQIRRKS